MENYLYILLGNNLNAFPENAVGVGKIRAAGLIADNANAQGAVGVRCNLRLG